MKSYLFKYQRVLITDPSFTTPISREDIKNQQKMHQNEDSVNETLSKDQYSISGVYVLVTVSSDEELFSNKLMDANNSERTIKALGSMYPINTPLPAES